MRRFSPVLHFVRTTQFSVIAYALKIAYKWQAILLTSAVNAVIMCFTRSLDVIRIYYLYPVLKQIACTGVHVGTHPAYWLLISGEAGENDEKKLTVAKLQVTVPYKVLITGDQKCYGTAWASVRPNLGFPSSCAFRISCRILIILTVMYGLTNVFWTMPPLLLRREYANWLGIVHPEISHS